MERYPINDTVFYGSEGVCRIVDIVKRRFQGQTEEYYVLQPVYNENSTIYVPIRNEALIGKMRRSLFPTHRRSGMRTKMRDATATGIFSPAATAWRSFR